MSLPSDRKDMADLFQRLAGRDAAAFDEIVTCLRKRLRAIARVRLEREPELAAVYEEEDAIQDGMLQMWRGIMAGKDRPPDGIDDFLRLSRTIIARRIMARARAERAAKRSPASSRDPGWSGGPLVAYVRDDLDVLQCAGPGPDALAIARDETRWLMGLLDPAVRDVAEWRLMGLTVDEIAARRGRPRRTIQRVLSEVHRIWREALRDRES